MDNIKARAVRSSFSECTNYFYRNSLILLKNDFR